mgnify:CR=1 FL=1
MHQKNSFLAIIPARKGSKRIPRKHLEEIGGKPMIQFTIEAAMSTIPTQNIFISTDDDDVINLSKKLGLDIPFIRPKNLSSDTTKTSDVIQHLLDWYEFKFKELPDNILLLQPTSPFRNAKDIELAIEKHIESSKKTLVSVSNPLQHPVDFILKGSDGKFKKLVSCIDEYKLQPISDVFFIDGGIYIINTVEFLDSHDLIGNDPEIIILPKNHAIDIDTLFDLDIARAVYNSKILSIEK